VELKALHKVSYGLYVVCSVNGERFNGQIANTVFQVAAEPPTIAVSINKKNLTHEFIRESKVYSASILAKKTPISFIGRFGFQSGRDVNKFEGINYKMGKALSPVVTDNTVAYLEVKVNQEVDVGTHTMFIGEVVDADILTEDELMTYAYYHEVKKGITPEAAAVYIKGE
jgi:flavin reductase (DIM6/NTAB) family NADH-FMN oxidoreductase RutF